MGYAVGAAARRRGAKVTLISGPTKLETPAGVERVDVRTAEEMRTAVRERGAQCTVAVFAAAVADFRLETPHARKMKRSGEELSIRLQPTTDILAEFARAKGERLVVGFAAETDRVAENARKKLQEKNADLMVANDVTAEGAGFDHDTNIVTLFSRDGRDLALPKLTKREVAERILDEVVRLRGIIRGDHSSRQKQTSTHSGE
jgi:phosphopantothenoylcysteine decarboxylase/phosphopantothenate--cysteine ligase